MEMGIGQAETLMHMAKDTDDYEMPEVLKDLAGIDRVIIAKKQRG